MTEQPPPPGGPPFGGPPQGPPADPPYSGYSPYPPPYPPPGPAPRRNPLRLVLALVAALVVLAAAIVVPVVLLSGDDDDVPAEARTTAPSPGQDAPEPEGLGDVRTYDDLEATHVTDPVDYAQTPPVGGPHFAEWLECGAYDSPVQDENAVHDLEHGAVWITYDPDLGADDVAALEQALPQNGILSPYDDLPAPVVVTVWGAQLALTGADDPRLAEFVEEYDDGVTAPEPFASCAGGTADGDGTPA